MEVFWKFNADNSLYMICELRKMEEVRVQDQRFRQGPKLALSGQFELNRVGAYP